MARRKADAMLQAKLEQAKQLEAEIRALKNKARDKTREDEEERRKIVGRVVRAHIAAHPDGELARAINRLLAEALTKASERELFAELPPVSASPSPQESQHAPMHQEREAS